MSSVAGLDWGRFRLNAPWDGGCSKCGAPPDRIGRSPCGDWCNECGAAWPGLVCTACGREGVNVEHFTLPARKPCRVPNPNTAKATC